MRQRRILNKPLSRGGAAGLGIQLAEHVESKAGHSRLHAARLLGHAHIATTIICAHLLKRGGTRCGAQ